jgi:hypothetical protein
VNIGLLMINQEDDILEATLAKHCEIVDVFYALDGTTPNDRSKAICLSWDLCGGYWTDADLPRPPYPELTTCGYRQWPYERAVEEHGWDHWFLELHGDEVWTFDPATVVDRWPGADGFVFPLPFFFPREGEEWDYDLHPFEQLRWHMKPGWPEFRMFHGSPGVYFDVDQHFNTRPLGIETVVYDPSPIKHYPYRSPEVQRARARLHLSTQFDPANYTHISEGDRVYWTDEMIDEARCEHHRVLACEQTVAV